ncbi:MAG: hypothetical protein K6G70_09695, partial [Bacteroidaceae bacterium]|nr:hypothetical protein [Bacteroidaceae bacterium]
MNYVSIKLSEHFSLEEMCKTNANLKNVPNEAQVENLKRLCKWLEMLRSEYNRRYGGPSPALPSVANGGFAPLCGAEATFSGFSEDPSRPRGGGS